MRNATHSHDNRSHFNLNLLGWPFGARRLVTWASKNPNKIDRFLRGANSLVVLVVLYVIHNQCGLRDKRVLLHSASYGLSQAKAIALGRLVLFINYRAFQSMLNLIMRRQCGPVRSQVQDTFGPLVELVLGSPWFKFNSELVCLRLSDYKNPRVNNDTVTNLGTTLTATTVFIINSRFTTPSLYSPN